MNNPEDTVWYHGSPLHLTELAAGSTVTRWKELAEAFSHKPPMLEYDCVNGPIRHNGTQDGILYIIDEPVIEGADIVKHPRSSMDEGVEWLTQRPLRLKRADARKQGQIICIHGTVCSGKTHYAKRLAKERNAVVLNHDEIGVPLFGLNSERFEEQYPKIRAYLFKMALDIMAVGATVILDWGFWNRADRRETTEYFTQHGYAVEWHGISITDEALRRNVRSRNLEMAAGRSDVYPADDNLLAKAADIIETPLEDEMDVWVKVDWAASNEVANR